MTPLLPGLWGRAVAVTRMGSGTSELHPNLWVDKGKERCRWKERDWGAEGRRRETGRDCS